MTSTPFLPATLLQRPATPKNLGLPHFSHRVMHTWEKAQPARHIIGGLLLEPLVPPIGLPASPFFLSLVLVSVCSRLVTGKDHFRHTSWATGFFVLPLVCLAVHVHKLTFCAIELFPEMGRHANGPFSDTAPVLLTCPAIPRILATQRLVASTACFDVKI